MAPPSRIGDTIAGKYRIERLLGEGGMGAVFAARHVRLDRLVAVKLMQPSVASNEQALRRFFDEARAAGSLRHPNVIDILDVDVDADGAAFMVMELLEGESLASLLERRGTLEVGEALALLDPVLDGLAAAHARGIVHRDLKPDNIFLAREGGVIVPKLLDFGIAKLRRESLAGTATGTIIGTPRYMAPEQAAGAKDLGPPADVWSMGAVYFEALAGRSHLELSDDTNLMAILAALATQRPRAIEELVPSVPLTVARAIGGALEREPSRRWPTVGAFRAALRGEVDPAAIGGLQTLAAETSSSRVAAATLPLDAARIPPTLATPPAPSTARSTARRGLARPTWVALALLGLALVGASAWALSRSLGASDAASSASIAPAPATSALPQAPSSEEGEEGGHLEPSAAPPGADGLVGDGTPSEPASDAPAIEASAEEPSEPPGAAQPPRARARAARRGGDDVRETAPPEPRAPRGGTELPSTRTGRWNVDDL